VGSSSSPGCNPFPLRTPRSNSSGISTATSAKETIRTLHKVLLKMVNKIFVIRILKKKISAASATCYLILLYIFYEYLTAPGRLRE